MCISWVIIIGLNTNSMIVYAHHRLGFDHRMLLTLKKRVAANAATRFLCFYDINALRPQETDRPFIVLVFHRFPGFFNIVPDVVKVATKCFKGEFLFINLFS